MWAYGLRCFNNLNNSLLLSRFVTKPKCIFWGSRLHFQLSLKPAIKQKREENKESGLGASHISSLLNRHAQSSWEKMTKRAKKATSWLFWVKTLTFGKKMAEKSMINVFFAQSQDIWVKCSLKFETGGLGINFFLSLLILPVIPDSDFPEALSSQS